MRFQSKEGGGRGGRWRPVELLEITENIQWELLFLDLLVQNYYIDVVSRGEILGPAYNWNTTAAGKSVRMRP